jgi:ATPase subunit of ABC transporter with duplicated ATPase domains
LLLDEPTRDLDEGGLRWLLDWLQDYEGWLVVASHDRRLLRSFDRFLIVAESGCRCFAGSFDDLERDLERERVEEERRYLRKLNMLADAEEKNEAIIRRRARKKRLGRLHEERRSPTRGQLYGNKSYAEASQGKAAKIRNARMTAVREWVRSSRRALAVELPLTMLMPVLPKDDGRDLIALDRIHLKRSDRLGVMGPNGAGKTTLLQAMLRRADRSRVGSIAQGASDWTLPDSLLQKLAVSPDEIARILVAHKFPLALAERPLASLSPGERVRAAFICLMQQEIELLVLDEPTDSLDLLGARALAEGLRAWPGGLVIATHDAELLEAAGVQRVLRLG